MPGTVLALSAAKILPESEIFGVLQDAANTHENAEAGPEVDLVTHKAVAVLINAIIKGGGSVRRF